MVIQEYVRSRKFIHMGSMISTMAVRWKAGPSRLMRYDTGYPMTRQISVAMMASLKDRRNTWV